jgi:hypothetical protein
MMKKFAAGMAFSLFLVAGTYAVASSLTVSENTEVSDKDKDKKKKKCCSTNQSNCGTQNQTNCEKK